MDLELVTWRSWPSLRSPSANYSWDLSFLWRMADSKLLHWQIRWANFAPSTSRIFKSQNLVWCSATLLSRCNHSSFGPSKDISISVLFIGKSCFEHFFAHLMIEHAQSAKRLYTTGINRDFQLIQHADAYAFSWIMEQESMAFQEFKSQADFEGIAVAEDTRYLNRLVDYPKAGMPWQNLVTCRPSQWLHSWHPSSSSPSQTCKV